MVRIPRREHAVYSAASNSLPSWQRWVRLPQIAPESDDLRQALLPWWWPQAAASRAPRLSAGAAKFLARRGRAARQPPAKRFTVVQFHPLCPCPRSSVNRAPGFEPGRRRFESFRGCQHECQCTKAARRTPNPPGGVRFPGCSPTRRSA